MSKNSSYEEYLKENGSLTYSVVGVSMLPLLRQKKDLFTVEKKEGRYQAGDVVLYHRPPDQYVLHRIIQVRPEDYVILGDNCVAEEYGIRDGDILGVMTRYIRNGKAHSTKELPYRIYSFLQMHFRGIRIFLKKTMVRIRRIGKKLIK